MRSICLAHHIHLHLITLLILVFYEAHFPHPYVTSGLLGFSPLLSIHVFKHPQYEFLSHTRDQVSDP
jgi:hypothetical protein